MDNIKDEAREEFARYDTDGNGLITPAEIRKVNEALGTHGLTAEEIEQVVKNADRDGDGRIALEEFIALVGGGRHERH